MFCPQCGAATEAHIKYCKACGFRLVDFGLQPALTESLTSTEAKSQLRRLKGTRTLVAGLLFWPPTLFTMLIAATNNGPEQEIAGAISVFLVLLSVATNGWGLFNLWRGGFFKTYKEQRIRAEAALLAAQQEPARLIAKPAPIQLPAQQQTPNEITPTPVAMPSSMFSNSVTEHTTRSLRPQSNNPSNIS
jgi:hypothetical protein